MNKITPILLSMITLSCAANKPILKPSTETEEVEVWKLTKKTGKDVQIEIVPEKSVNSVDPVREKAVEEVAQEIADEIARKCHDKEEDPTEKELADMLVKGEKIPSVEEYAADAINLFNEYYHYHPDNPSDKPDLSDNEKRVVRAVVTVALINSVRCPVEEAQRYNPKDVQNRIKTHLEQITRGRK